MALKYLHGFTEWAEGEGEKQILPENQSRVHLAASNGSRFEIRYTLDGSAPTQTIGFRLMPGKTLGQFGISEFALDAQSSREFYKGEIRALVLGGGAAIIHWLEIEKEVV